MYQVRVEEAASGNPIEEPVSFEDELFAHRRLESALGTSQAEGGRSVRVTIIDPSGAEVVSLTTADWAAGSYLFEDGLYAHRT